MLTVVLVAVLLATQQQVAAVELVEQKGLRYLSRIVNCAPEDIAHDMPVRYKGILPDLFKEGKGVVAEGKLSADGVFNATQVLAKHDENYMPPEAAHALEQAQKAQETIVK